MHSRTLRQNRPKQDTVLHRIQSTLSTAMYPVVRDGFCPTDRMAAALRRLGSQGVVDYAHQVLAARSAVAGFFPRSRALVDGRSSVAARILFVLCPSFGRLRRRDGSVHARREHGTPQPRFSRPRCLSSTISRCCSAMPTRTPAPRSAASLGLPNRAALPEAGDRVRRAPSTRGGSCLRSAPGLRRSQ